LLFVFCADHLVIVSIIIDCYPFPIQQNFCAPSQKSTTPNVLNYRKKFVVPRVTQDSLCEPKSDVMQDMT